jgi:hypothetical protein
VPDSDVVDTRIAVARLETQVAHLTAAVAEMKLANTMQSSKLDAIQSTLSEARGGWRLMMMVGGASSAIGGMVTWIVAHIPWRG